MTRKINPVTVAIARTVPPSCYVCGIKDGAPDGYGDAAELRPYGKNGAWICYYCMIGNSEREAEAHRQFDAQLGACGPIGILGETTGPRPLKKGNQ